jgi:hypothetical protein
VSRKVKSLDGSSTRGESFQTILAGVSTLKLDLYGCLSLRLIDGAL